MRPLQLSHLGMQQIDELNELYRTTRDIRLRSKAQMILLNAEQGLSPPMSLPRIAKIVRKSDQMVRNWFWRYETEGIEGLGDAPRPGTPKKVTPEYVKLLIEAVRLRPRSLGLPFSMWTLARPADYMSEQTGIRVDDETVRRYLKKAEIVLNKPQHTISSPEPEQMVKKRRSKIHEMG